jgi:T-complex protein 1 subunit eta
VGNPGFDTTAVVEKLRQRHATGQATFGVAIDSEEVLDSYTACIWEPAMMKVNAIGAASEAACLVLAVDETVEADQSQQQGQMVKDLAAKSRGR